MIPASDLYALFNALEFIETSEILVSRMYRRKRSRSRSPGRQPQRPSFSRSDVLPYSRETPSVLPRRPSTAHASSCREVCRTSQRGGSSPRRSREDAQQHYTRSPRRPAERKTSPQPALSWPPNNVLHQKEPQNSDETKRRLWTLLTAQLAKQGLLPLSQMPHSAVPVVTSPLRHFSAHTMDSAFTQEGNIGQGLLPLPQSVETHVPPSFPEAQFHFNSQQCFAPGGSHTPTKVVMPQSHVAMPFVSAPNPASVPTSQQSSSIFIAQGSSATPLGLLPFPTEPVASASSQPLAFQPPPPPALTGLTAVVSSATLPAFETLEISPLPALDEPEFENSDNASEAGTKFGSRGGAEHNPFKNGAMTEVDQKLLQDYVAREVVSELTPYLRKNWISSKEVFKALARKLSKDIVAVEHAKNVHNGKTASKIKDFVAKHMRRARKKALDPDCGVLEDASRHDLDLK